jgi:hypothetical protein
MRPRWRATHCFVSKPRNMELTKPRSCSRIAKNKTLLSSPHITSYQHLNLEIFQNTQLVSSQACDNINKSNELKSWFREINIFKKITHDTTFQNPQRASIHISQPAFAYTPSAPLLQPRATHVPIPVSTLMCTPKSAATTSLASHAVSMS